eukprot:6182849-Pleurochrysis_carterae.AAC.2
MPKRDIWKRALKVRGDEALLEGEGLADASNCASQSWAERACSRWASANKGAGTRACRLRRPPRCAAEACRARTARATKYRCASVIRRLISVILRVWRIVTFVTGRVATI